MPVEAVALRLEPIQGRSRFAGKSPIVVVTDDGQAGAALDGQLPGGFRAMTMAVNGAYSPGNALGVESRLRPEPSSPHKIEEVVVILDKSGSMGYSFASIGGKTKMQRVADLIDEVGPKIIPKNTSIRLIHFNVKSYGGEDKLDLDGLKREIRKTIPADGTDFYEPFKRLCDQIGPEDLENHSRRIVFFFTDGKENDASRVKSFAMAGELQRRNIAAYVIGIGTDYEQLRIIRISGKIGFGGWAHIDSTQNNVIARKIPRFIKDIERSDHYVSVSASGSFHDFHSFKPAIQPVFDRVMNIGYQRRGVGVLFEEHEDIALKLMVGPNAVAKQDLEKPDIPILDVAQAGAHFELIKPARRAAREVRLFLAQLEQDSDAMEDLARESEELRAQVDDLTETNTRYGFESNESRSATSIIANSADLDIEQVNFWSAVGGTPSSNSGDPAQRNSGADETRASLSAADGDTRLLNVTDPGLADIFRTLMYDGRSGEQSSADQGGVGLHSGELARPDRAPNSFIPPANNPDADAYRGVIPVGHPKLVISDRQSSLARQLDLHSMAVGEERLVGRDGECHVRLTPPAISRKHCMITRRETGFEVRDLASRNSTLVNGRPISVHLLQDGDRIEIASITMKFHAGK